MKPSLRFSFLLFTLTACNSATGPAGQPPLVTELPRALSTAELRIVDGANAFAFDLRVLVTIPVLARVPALLRAAVDPVRAACCAWRAWSPAVQRLV